MSGDTQQPKPPRIESAQLLKEVMTGYYAAAKLSEGSSTTRIAWVTSGAPVEILYAADVIPVYPENHAALCGAQRIAVDLCEAAETRGFSRDLCSYVRTDLGAIFSERSPVGGLPRPDFLVCCNNICGTVTKWYQQLQRHFDVPLIFVDAPFQHRPGTDTVFCGANAEQNTVSVPSHPNRPGNGDSADRRSVISLEDSVAWYSPHFLDPNATQYVHRQLLDMKQTVGDLVGTPISDERLAETLDLAKQATALWGEILDLLVARPSPMTSFDTFIHMAPIVVLRGTERCIEYYEALLAEMKQRVEQGIGAVPKERFRLGWDNIPIWFAVRAISRKFAAHNACVSVATYASAWAQIWGDDDSGDPLRALAEAYLGVYINLSLEARLNTLKEMVRKYALDGIVMHSDRSCRAYSLGQYDLARMLGDQLGLPVLILEADMNDSRTYAEEAVNTRIDAFMETLEARA